MSWILILATLVPLAAFLFVALCNTPRVAPWYAVLTPLPALLIALVAPDITMQAPYILFGVVWELDSLSRPLLAMTAILWLLGGLFIRDYLRDDPALRRFLLFWLLTMLGNLALIMARDIASFYTGFALMTFAAYGLVVHNASREALHAGKVYLVMALIGEVLILAGFLTLLPGLVEPMLHYVPLAIATESYGFVAAALLFTGFGVKAGVLGLHMWLPLAHPVAPTPASAVLSGAMIKAGLLAWMQMLPLTGEAAELVRLDTFAMWIIALGLGAAFVAGVVGSLQDQAKAVLAYSSISQMGIMTTLVGVALLRPELTPALTVAIVAYIVHHGLAKGALFLTVGLAQHPAGLSRVAVLLIALLPALALAGAPLTSGAAAKYLMKDGLYNQQLDQLIFALTLAAVATALLMLRFLYLLGQQKASDKAMPSVTLAVAGSIIASLLLIWWLPLQLPFMAPISVSALWDATWTLGLAVLIAGVAYKSQSFIQLSIPAGDIVWPLQRILRLIARLYPPLRDSASWLHQRWQHLTLGGSKLSLLAATHIFSRLLSERTLQRNIALAAALLLITFTLLSTFKRGA
ncbi:hypothetical protein CWE12_08335 [Aliidiomarina sedimenti]|uniref:NADH:quinone oxidoreductase/Mrp antiporter transmembrane domain-containing protein n=1 Tax=Aliidiomarina sedimenti TaxID=1933879 RepID=A0ABY0BZ54_9GAMM|nr:complex I subunit 5 family protein [Aliidiomarina sedimenti]RUO29960.1 hypothetical protein CWE12_08335 [Aliidiomarina sedimenti]